MRKLSWMGQWLRSLATVRERRRRTFVAGVCLSSANIETFERRQLLAASIHAENVVCDSGESSVQLWSTTAPLSLKDFGAVGDGVADDTAAVQAAFDSAAGGALFLDPGVYRLTDVILISSETTIEGAGDASVLAFDWADQSTGAEFHLGNRNRTNEEPADHHITLKNFVIEGGYPGEPYGADQQNITHGLSLRRVRDVDVSGVIVRSVSGFGMAIAGLVRGRFTDNFIHHVGRDGLTSFPLVREHDPTYPTYPLIDLVISNNRIIDIGDDAIAVHAGPDGRGNQTSPPQNITITGNTIIGRTSDHPLAQGRGIVLSGVFNALVSGNSLRDTVSTGILVQHQEHYTGSLRSTNIRLVENTILRAGQVAGQDRVKYGIQVKGADDVVIRHNVVADSADRGIDVRSATQVDVVRNTVTGGGGWYAIMVSGGPEWDAQQVRVLGNTVDIRERGAVLLYNVIDWVEMNTKIV